MDDASDQDSRPLTEEDRRKILARIHSLLYWLGEFIPEEEILEGQKLPLRDIVYQFIIKPNPSDEEVEAALSLANALNKKAKEQEACLQSCEGLTKGQAHQIMDEINGLLRAVDEIRHSKGADEMIKSVALMARVNDEKRWLAFVKEVS